MPGFAPPFSQIPLTFLSKSRCHRHCHAYNERRAPQWAPSQRPPRVPYHPRQQRPLRLRHENRHGPPGAGERCQTRPPSQARVPCPRSRPSWSVSLVNYPVLLLTSWLASIAIDPPHGTPPPGEEDAKMAEDSPSNTQHLDVQMADVGLNGRLSEKRSREPTPVAASFSTVVDASTSYTTPNEYSTQEDEGSVPPPAKRARTFSDPDQASIMHVSGSYLCTPLLAC